MSTGGVAGRACCMPRADDALREAAAASAVAVVPVRAVVSTPSPCDAAGRGDTPMVALPGGAFRMGTDSDEGFPEDGEGPSRIVRVAPCAIGATTVTNRAYAAFVRATGHVTDAERRGGSFVFYLQLPPALRADAGRSAPGLPWWVDVRDACWQRPEGPESSVCGREEHPVVHVSWHDAVAYCAWAGVRLPDEVEWEYAARGGLDGKRYPWGDELADADGRPRCHIWQGGFPNAPARGWRPGTLEADALEPNGFGLHQTSGNVWEWCANTLGGADGRGPDADAGPSDVSRDDRRAMRGGSFLCHDSYCNRYRVAARSAGAPRGSSSHCGFRVAS